MIRDNKTLIAANPSVKVVCQSKLLTHHHDLPQRNEYANSNFEVVSAVPGKINADMPTGSGKGQETVNGTVTQKLIGHPAANRSKY